MVAVRYKTDKSGLRALEGLLGKLNGCELVATDGRAYPPGTLLVEGRTCSKDGAEYRGELLCDLWKGDDQRPEMFSELPGLPAGDL